MGTNLWWQKHLLTKKLVVKGKKGGKMNCCASESLKLLVTVVQYFENVVKCWHICFRAHFLQIKLNRNFLSLFIAAKAKLRFKFDALCWSWSRLQILAPKICIHIKNPLSIWPGSKAMDVYSKKKLFLQCWTICKILCCQLQNWAQI